MSALPLVIDFRAKPVRKAVCPNCAKLVNGAAYTGLLDPLKVAAAPPIRPVTGDIAICDRCGAANAYQDDGSLEPADESTFDADTRETIRRARLTMQMAGRAVRR